MPFESDSKPCFETRLTSSSSSSCLRPTTKHSSLMIILLNIITMIMIMTIMIISFSSSLFVSCDDSPSFSLSSLDPLESNNNNNHPGKNNNHHHHQRIRSQSFREETSIVSLSSGNQIFDLKQELLDSISSIILGNNQRQPTINFLIQSSRQVIEEKRHKTSSSRSNLFQDHEDSFSVRDKDITRSSSSSVPQNITGFVGHPVFLHCFVDSLGSLSSDKTVSWIRLKDFSLLTVGLFTYTSDERFVVRLNDQGNDWCLSIKHVSFQDQGLYECQVNSDPPRSSFYRLIVKESETRMIGGPDMFVRTGQPLILNCILKNPPSTLTSFIVFWYKEDKMINYDLSESSRGFTQVINKRDEEEVVARLTIKSARLNDSGNYSCHFVGSSSGSSSSGGDDDEDGRNGGRKSHNNNNNIYVHVLQGEKRSSSSSSSSDVLQNNNHHHHNNQRVVNSIQNDDQIINGFVSSSSSMKLSWTRTLLILILGSFFYST